MSNDWPSPRDFIGMLQNPQKAFRDAGLRSLVLQNGANGQPISFAGGFAIVCKATLAGKPTAVRVFQKSAPSRQEHYSQISNFLNELKKRKGLARAPEYLVDFTFWSKEILVNGKRWPIVTMDWVPGVTLDKWVAGCVQSGKSDALLKASDQWVQMLDTLRNDYGIAHGDLQHGNVMVDNSNRFTLVDYDGMCVPKLEGRANLEVGLPPYQHPKRHGKTRLTPRIDNFSSIVIYTALRAVALKPELWRIFVSDLRNDNLLFQIQDWQDRRDSRLHAELQRCGDAKIRKAADVLFGVLDEEDLEKIPALADVLDPYDEVAALLSQKAFDDAVELLERHYKTALPPPPEPPSDAPDAIKPRIREARKKVGCRRSMSAAVSQGNEREMSRLFHEHSSNTPPLLEDYPRARKERLVDIARHADRVLKLIDQLTAQQRSIEAYQKGAKGTAQTEEILQARPWRRLPQIWHDPADHGVLVSRASARAFSSLIDYWTERNSRCDAVLEQFRVQPIDPARLAEAWSRLGSDGHPETDVHKVQIEAVLAKDAAWQKFRKVLPHPPYRPASQAGDTALLALWKQYKQLFAGAKHITEPVGQAEARLALVSRIKMLHANSLQGLRRADEQGIVDAGGQLVDAYHYEQRTRANLARRRIESLAALEAALTTVCVSDRALSQTWHALGEVEALAMVTEPDRLKRIDIALRRIAVLDRLPHGNVPTHVRDAAVLESWNAGLFAKSEAADRCYDAGDWPDHFKNAVRRRELLSELKVALGRDDWEGIAQIAFDDLFDNYMFPDRWIEKIGAVRKQRTLAEQFCDALVKNGDAPSVKQFHARPVRLFPKLFAPYQDQLKEWVEREILPCERLGLKHEFGSNGWLSSDGGQCQLRWLGPNNNYTQECVVVVSEQRPQHNDDPLAIPVKYRQPQHRHKPGGTPLPVDPTWEGCYVAVWAYIDLGFDKLRSEPLILGRLKVT